MSSRAQPLVYILLLNWNNWRFTTECLASLKALEYDNWKVLVLDNGSKDESLPQIRRQFPEAAIVENGANLGFAKGNNVGIRLALAAGADYVWLLNNDTTVAPDALRRMVDNAEADPSVGAVGSAIYYSSEPDRLQAWGGGAVSFWLGRSRLITAPDQGRRLDFLSGACLLVKRAPLLSVGLLDESLFLYWDDADYCFRLRRAGWRLAVAGDSKVWHKETASIGKKSVYCDSTFNRSAVRFFRTNSPFPFLSISVGVALRITKRALVGDFARARAVWAGARG